MTTTLIEGLIPKTSLPHIIAKYFQSDTIQFRLEESKDEIHLTEFNDLTSECPLEGILDLPSLTVESMLAERQKDRESEQ